MINSAIKSALIALVFLASLPCYAEDEANTSSYLQGQISKKRHVKELKEGSGQRDSQGLNGQASTNVLSEDDPRMLIEWDKWRNKFSKKVWVKLNEKLVGGLFIPLGPTGLAFGEGGGYDFRRGTEATYVCEITSDRRVVNAYISVRSGDPVYDQLLLHCVQSLDGKHSLKFPEGSMRQKVTMAGRLSIGSPIFREHQYDDREVVRVSKAAN